MKQLTTVVEYGNSWRTAIQSRGRAVTVAALLAGTIAGGPFALAAAPSRSEARGQQPGAIKVEIDYVQVDVTVTDAEGRFVHGLGAEAFEVYEDGKRQQVSTFAFVDLPIRGWGFARTAGVGPLVGSDVASNVELSAGRVYVIVLDDLHIHPLRSARVKQSAREFIERHLGRNDLAAVLHTSGRIDAGQDFTNQRPLLLQAVDKFVGRKMRSSVLERLEAYQRRGNEPNRSDLRLDRVTDPLDAQRADQARRALKTLSSLADLLAREQGRRKAVLLISEGLDYPLQEGMAQTSSGLSTFTSTFAPDVLRDLQQTIRAAARANVSIYAIDPRGLAGPGEDMIEVSNFPDNPHLGLTPGAFQDELRQAQDSLRIISERTGGVASVTTNDFSGAFERIVRDSGTYYLLGYRSSDSRRDGRYRSIEVKVAHPGVRVRARSGYAAERSPAPPTNVLTSSEEPSAVLRGALNAPLPSGSLPLRLFAAAFRGAKDASVSIGVEMDARNFKLVEQGGVYTGKVELALVAFDQRATFKGGDRHVLLLELKPETYKAVQARGIRVLFRLNLPAGRFQLKAAAHEPATGATGNVSYDLEVPNFRAAPIGMSGLVLTAARAADIPTAKSDPLFQSVLPFPPTGLRTFYPNEKLIALAEVYGSDPSTRAGIDMVTTVRDADGRTLFSTRDHGTADANSGLDDAFAYAVGVPLKDLPPGRYLLTMEAQPRGAHAAVALRDVTFEVAASADPGK